MPLMMNNLNKSRTKTMCTYVNVIAMLQSNDIIEVNGMIDEITHFKYIFNLRVWRMQFPATDDCCHQFPRTGAQHTHTNTISTYACVYFLSSRWGRYCCRVVLRRFQLEPKLFVSRTCYECLINECANAQHKLSVHFGSYPYMDIVTCCV